MARGKARSNVNDCQAVGRLTIFSFIVQSNNQDAILVNPMKMEKSATPQKNRTCPGNSTSSNWLSQPRAPFQLKSYLNGSQSDYGQ